MTQENKDLLLKDLCARLIYGVNINVPNHYGDGVDGIHPLDVFWFRDMQNNDKIYKPYLRSMSSMTDEEKRDYNQRVWHYDDYISEDDMPNAIDWLLSHHFDYRGLIEKGLAIEAPEGMYK